MKKLIYLFCFLLIPLSSYSQIQYDTLNVKQIGEGAFHYSIAAPSVPWTIEVVEIDLTSETYSLETVKANDRLSGYEKTSSMASRKSVDGHRVIAAINGDFYGGGGVPTNLQVLKGEILRTPINRAVFGYSDNNSMFINTTNYQGVLLSGESTYTINDINSVRNSNEIVFYNHFFGSSTSTNEFGTELTLKAIDPWIVNGEVRTLVVSKSENVGNSLITDSTFVLSGHGSSSSILASFSIGDTISINHKITPGTDAIREAVGGSGKFLNEGINQGNWPERHPRSALGFNADTTKFYLVTVDGRQNTSAGMTVTELGEFMKGFGAHYALNLDGGGSTTLVVHDKVVNSPSDGAGERLVSNALMIVSNKSKIGELERLKISPSINKVYRGESFAFNIEGSDSNYFPIDISIEELTFYLSQGFDAEINSEGVFTAGDHPDTGYVIVDYNGLKDSSEVIIKGITDFNLYPINTITDNKNELVFFNRSFDFDKVEQLVPNSAINWEVQNEFIGEIDKGVFIGKNEGVTNVIAKYDGVSDTSQVEVQIGEGTRVLESFEELEGLNLNGTNIDLGQSSLELSSTNRTEGTNGIKLDYELIYQGDPNIWAYINTDIPIFGLPDTIIIDGLSDGEKHLIDIGIEDENGEEFTIRLKRYADNTSFEEYYIKMDDVVPKDPFSKFYYPITIKSIGVKIKTGQETGVTYSGTLFFDNLRASYPGGIGVSIDEEIVIPSSISLNQNYPNPFNPSTNIEFSLPKSDVVTLNVYDVLGRKVSTLIDKKIDSGNHIYTFRAENLASGMYIYRLETTEGVFSKVMMLIK
jgi:hypothetical protein